jgi:hypothetical protein
VLEYDRAVDGREDEKLLFRSFKNMVTRLSVCVSKAVRSDLESVKAGDSYWM